MSKTIKPSALGAAISKELTVYHADVLEKVNAAGEKAIKALVKKTKATAPKKSGDFRKAITYTTDTNAAGDKTYTWGAKAPKHRLTHLLVKGHLAQNGTRVPGDPFLEEACEQVFPEYEKDIEEALK